jgi:two-component sensor histidine kinase
LEDVYVVHQGQENQVGEKGSILTGKKGCEYAIEEVRTPLMTMKSDEGGTVIIVRDITERKQAEEQIKASLLEKETMLKEIHHRVKNNLQVISSLLDLQSSYVQDEKAKEALRESMNRVRTMATIHTQLYQSQDLTKVDFEILIRNLISNISQSYGRTVSPVKINVDTDKTRLGIDASIPCGLILNELVSNALKHAFPGGKEGEINITMRSEDNQVVLTVSDNGIGFPESIDFNNLKSLGLQLVNILVGQMNGKIDLQVDGGTTWTIIFPVNNERGRRNGQGEDYRC